MQSKKFEIGFGNVKKVIIGDNSPLVFIGGPCAIESRDHAFFMAEAIKNICEKLKIPYIFKSCYDKDCRSSIESFHGVGIDEGLRILSDVRQEFSIPVVSDFSDPAWAKDTAEVCDLIQIPAYLCRQTSILRAAAETGRPIHLKKGQFMSPWNMRNSVKKIENFGNKKIILTDRGTFFGYNSLVNDFRSLPIMAETGYPVCYDATHSIQNPTSMGNISGGERRFIPALVRAASAVGIDALFMEVHDNPPKALSDPNTQIYLSDIEKVLSQAKEIHELKNDLSSIGGEDNVK
jgi:2-dehydro-3-deoxyphosphooctonate aldolase (KDO 8-P synthase)